MPHGFPPDLSPLQPDDHAVRIPGHRLVGRLGEGGMGVVYAALDSRERPAALKLMRAEMSSDIDRRHQRFHTEIQALGRIRDDHVVPLLGSGVFAELPWLVTAYVPGRNLQRRGRLSPAGLLQLAHGTAGALCAIHGAKYVHRDLKPSNVMIRPDGRPVVLDFGIARSLTGEKLTVPGAPLVGTAGTISPERYGGSPGEPPADVFAWGCLVVFAATGRHPFAEAPKKDVRHRVLHAPPELHGFRGPLADLAVRALAKRPEDRPTARELLERTRALGAPPAPEPRPRRSPSRPPGSPTRRPGSGSTRRTTLPRALKDFSTSDSATLLVLEMQDQHADLPAWLRRNRARIVRELRQAGRRVDPELGRTLERAPNGLAAEEACAALAAHLAPHVPPRYRGHPVNDDGLVRLASGGPREQQLLYTLLEERAVILGHAARHDCGHRLTCFGRYFGQDCRILRTVRSRVTGVVEHTRMPLRELRDQIRAEHVRRGAPTVLLPPDRVLVHQVHATALLVRLRDSEVDRHRGEVFATECPTRWWASQRESAYQADPNTDRGLARIVIASVAAGTARRFAASNVSL